MLHFRSMYYLGNKFIVSENKAYLPLESSDLYIFEIYIEFPFICHQARSSISFRSEMASKRKLLPFGMAKMNSGVMKDFQEKPIFFKIKWKIIKKF